MRVRQSIGSLTKAMVVGACIYGFVKWQSLESTSSDVTSFASRACVDEVGTRYDVSDARPYQIDRNSSGYVVRVSATTTRGKAAKVVCLANSHGGINEVFIDER